MLLLKTYHEIAHPIALLRSLRSSLKPGAKIGIIDRNGNGENQGVSKDVVVREAAQAGYELNARRLLTGGRFTLGFKTSDLRQRSPCTYLKDFLLARDDRNPASFPPLLMKAI